MKNEPVAWINRDEYHGWLNWDKNTEMPINIPLYTHAVKELTDEEILEICNQFEEGVAFSDIGWSIPSEEYLYFARAILRKASEK